MATDAHEWHCSAPAFQPPHALVVSLAREPACLPDGENSELAGGLQVADPGSQSRPFLFSCIGEHRMTHRCSDYIQTTRTLEREERKQFIDNISDFSSGFGPVFPDIEASSSTLQCKFPPFSAKSVRSSVNLPIGSSPCLLFSYSTSLRIAWDYQGRSCTKRRDDKGGEMLLVKCYASASALTWKLSAYSQHSSYHEHHRQRHAVL